MSLNGKWLLFFSFLKIGGTQGKSKSKTNSNKRIGFSTENIARGARKNQKEEKKFGDDRTRQASDHVQSEQGEATGRTGSKVTEEAQRDLGGN